jgi:L-aspartate oxidase
VFGRRAALRALDEPPPSEASAPEEPTSPAPTRETRKAMWRHAGLERDADGLRPLLGDPHPLARLVARSALFREESRGAHARADFPDADPGLDEHHTILRAGDEEPRFERWE